MHLDPGASQPRHTHEASEQIWYALEGVGTLLLAGDEGRPFAAGDVVRFEDGDVHGLRNMGPDEFAYLSVTAHYSQRWLPEGIALPLFLGIHAGHLLSFASGPLLFGFVVLEQFRG